MKSHPHFSLCGRCNRPALRGVCCPICGRRCCRWKCYAHHMDQHRAARTNPRASAASNEAKEEEVGRAGLAASGRFAALLRGGRDAQQNIGNVAERLANV